MRGKLKVKSSKFKVIILLVVSLMLVVAIYNQQKAKVLEEEKFILNPPAESSKSALKKHAQMVKKLAQDGNLLEIQNCQPKPLVLKAKEGSDLEIKNQSTINHRIIIDSKHYYDIPGGGSKKIKAEFKYGPGDYGYVCEKAGNAKIAGFLHVVP